VTSDRVTKLCETCGRFQLYAPDDSFCIVCGYRSLVTECTCGRGFEYALGEPPGAGLHCPRCGRDFRQNKGRFDLD
jgi:hypothetical protein